ncbi:MAG TPA: DUF3127 domain-containing protein [Flavipsychrobacter sp.]|nr:DUF3127 domain-containing protein [Flavipsychrobacter sp.]
MSFEITGKLAVKYDTQQVKESFKKREFVMEIAEEINGNVYTNFAKMQLVQGKCELLDRFNEGDQIKVNFNIKGNRWERDGKVNYITNLDAWRIEAATAGTAASPAGYGAPASQPMEGTNSYYNPSPESADDLPF